MLNEKINAEYHKIKAKNPSYSVRAFSKKLEMDSSTVSAIINGKRKISPQLGFEILSKLKISKFEKQKILIQQLKIEKEYIQNKKVIEDQLEVISGWEHYAILSLIETKNFQSTIAYISERLDLPKNDVDLALKRLRNLKLIEIKNNRILLCQNGVVTTEGVPSKALRKAHKQCIEKALASIENQKTEYRDISGITMAIDKTKLPEAKLMIQDFRKSLSEFLESEDKTSVYRLNIQLFSLEKTEDLK